MAVLKNILYVLLFFIAIALAIILFPRTTPEYDLLRRVETELIIDDSERLSGLYDELIKLEPENGHYWHKLGDYYVDIGKYEEGIEALKKAEALRPNDQTVRLSLGWAYLKNRNFERSQSYFEDLNEEYPRNPTIMNGLGELYYTEGERERAKKIWRQAIKIDPFYRPVQHNLVRLNPERIPQERTGILLLPLLNLLATQAYNSQDIPNTLRFYEELIHYTPTNVEYYRLLAKTYQSQFEYKKALNVVLQGLDVDPENRELLLMASYLYILLKDPESARPLLTGLYENDKKSLDLINAMGLLETLSHDPKRAKKFFDRALKIDPNDETAKRGLEDLQVNPIKLPRSYLAALSILGNQSLQKDDYKTGLYYYAMIDWLNNQPPGPDPYPRWVMDLIAQAKANKQKGCYYFNPPIWSLLISYYPKDPYFYFQLGVAYEDLQYWDLAFEAHFTSLTKDKKYVDAMVRIIGLSINFQYYGYAESLLNYAYDLEPERADVLGLYGRLAFRLGNLDEAFLWLGAALELDPRDDAALFYSGLTTTAWNRPDLAEDFFYRNMETSPLDMEPWSHWYRAREKTEPSFIYTKYYSVETERDYLFTPERSASRILTAKLTTNGGLLRGTYPINERLRASLFGGDELITLKNILADVNQYQLRVYTMKGSVSWEWDDFWSGFAYGGTKTGRNRGHPNFPLSNIVLFEPGFGVTHSNPFWTVSGTFDKDSIVGIDYPTNHTRLYPRYITTVFMERNFPECFWTVGCGGSHLWYNDPVHNQQNIASAWVWYTFPHIYNYTFQVGGRFDYNQFNHNVPDYYSFYDQYTEWVRLRLTRSFSDRFIIAGAFDYGFRNTWTRTPANNQLPLLFPFLLPKPEWDYNWITKYYIEASYIINDRLSMKFWGEKYYDSNEYKVMSAKGEIEWVF